MYDYYLDPNACLYGLHNGSEPLHAMYNPVDGIVMIANNTFTAYYNLQLEVKTIDMNGKADMLREIPVEIRETTTRKFAALKDDIDAKRKLKGVFLHLRLLDGHKKVVSENLYWLPDATGNYSGLQQMAAANVQVTAKRAAKDSITVTISNPANGPVAFFNRVAVVNAKTKERILPAFYSDNYVSVLPGEKKTVTISYPAANSNVALQLYGWNVKEQYVNVGM
jgi:hypothetical protein